MGMQNGSYRFKTALLAALTLGTFAAGARATTIVNYGGDYVSGNRIFSSIGGYDSVTGTFATISPSSGYSGPVISGQLSATPTSTTTRIGENGTSDLVYLKLPLASSGWSLVLFQKAGFLNGASSETVDFTSDSYVAISVQADIARENYLVIKAGGSYYITGDIINTSTTSLNFTAQDWFNYDPTTPGTVGSTPATNLVQGGIIADIQAVGILSSKSASNVDDAFRFTTFTVETAAVPEAASLGLLGLGGLLLTARRRK